MTIVSDIIYSVGEEKLLIHSWNKYPKNIILKNLF